jgi:hypothetical protein
MKERVAMCKLVDCHTNYGEICKVADIKANYISNIVNTAHICSDIERIVLFGSALEERCKYILMANFRIMTYCISKMARKLMEI